MGACLFNAVNKLLTYTTAVLRTETMCCFSCLSDRKRRTQHSCGGVQSLKCAFPKTVLRVKVAELVQVTQSCFNTSEFTTNDTCLRLFINLKPKFLAEVRTICEGRNQCNVSAQSLLSDPCPRERKYLQINFKCEVMSTGYPGKTIIIKHKVSD